MLKLVLLSALALGSQAFAASPITAEQKAMSVAVAESFSIVANLTEITGSTDETFRKMNEIIQARCEIQDDRPKDGGFKEGQTSYQVKGADCPIALSSVTNTKVVKGEDSSRLTVLTRNGYQVGNDPAFAALNDIIAYDMTSDLVVDIYRSGVVTGTMKAGVNLYSQKYGPVGLGADVSIAEESTQMILSIDFAKFAIVGKAITAKDQATPKYFLNDQPVTEAEFAEVFGNVAKTGVGGGGSGGGFPNE